MPAEHDSPAQRLSGLSSAEVADRVARGLVNRPARSDLAEYGAIVARNVLTLYNALVAPAAIALFLLRDYRAAWAVSSMAIANSLLGLVQEVRAKRRLDQLAILTQTKARVMRDGAERIIPANDVVQDDIVLLATGDAVVADGAVLDERALEIDEALLTGESDPVPRKVGEKLLSGSFCVAGDGAYRADNVGGNAFAQQLSSEARRYKYAPSPMQRTLDTLIRILTAIAITLCVTYVALYFIRGFSTDDLVRMVAATITSMVPQGLVLMTTLAFTLGAVRMSARGAMVQHLNAVESMASVDVLCMDKTGTLTTNRLALDRITPLIPERDRADALLRLFAWGSADERNKTILALRESLGATASAAEAIERQPFKSQSRVSALRIPVDGQLRALALGAFETLRPHLDPAQVREAESSWRELQATGMRVLLLAERPGEQPLSGTLEGAGWTPVAMVALSDELRPEAGPVLAALAGQKIQFKVLSGDNPETVRATIGHLDLPLARASISTGDEFAAASDRLAAVRDHDVFGRVAPRQKLDIVAALQSLGHHVAMIGDGVNDVLPLKRADLGIAMGEGSAAAKTVAGLVLENNDFQMLPAALDEGRTILNNLRRAAKLFLLKNVYLLLLIIVGFGLLNLGFPLEPQQVTLLNALTIGGPVFLIMIRREPSHTAFSNREFLAEVGWFAISAGIATACGGLIVWIIAGRSSNPAAQSALLAALVIMGLGNVLRIAHSDRWLMLWTFAALVIFLACMYLPSAGTIGRTPLSAAHFFELTPLTAGDWLQLAAVALPAVGLAHAFGYARPFSMWKSTTSGK